MCNVRLFLFHTALASGAPPGFTPLAAAAVLGELSRRPLPDFATNRGRAPRVAVDPARMGEGPVAGFSPSFEGAAVEAPLDARKVLFTETGLNDANFFTADAERP